MSEYVIFFIDRETNNFKSYQIFKDKSKEELEKSVANYNNEPKKDKAVIVEDPIVIAAICSRESTKSLKSILREFKDDVEDLRGMLSSLENYIERVERDVRELKEG